MSGERKTNASGQFLVRWGEDNRAELGSLLKSHGYTGSGIIDSNGGYAGVKVICVDKKKHCYMQVSASTCAAWRQSGIMIHTVEGAADML